MQYLYRYSFDQMTGNLNSRQNFQRGLSESFNYDGLDRLTNITGPQNLATTFYTNGSVKTKSDVGTADFIYGSAAGPYCLTKVPTTSGLVKRDVQAINYNSFEKIGSISESDFSANFVYNTDFQRAKMEVKQGGNTLLTRWYTGGSYMKETAQGVTKEYTWLGGDAYSAPAVAITQNGSTVFYYLLRDYLGNVTHVVNSNNTLLAEYSYDAWGRRRNPVNWSYDLSGQPELFAGRGFTGHEHLPWFNLVNMNGRLYDPATGRFLSPDNFVQMPDFTQNFNRYSYCLNNPLKYTDLSGDKIDFIKGMFSSFFGIAAFNPGMKWAKGEVTFGQALGEYAVNAATFITSGGVSGLDIAFSNTLGLIAGSIVNSTGNYINSGGKSDFIVSIGFGSYNFSSEKFNYLFKKDNKWYEDMGYTFGALANVQDLFSGFKGTDIKVGSHNSFNLKTPHSYISGNNIDISVANRIPSNSNNMFQYAWRILTKKKFWEAGYYDVPDKSNDWVINLNNVKSSSLQNITERISLGKGIFGWGKLRFGLGFGCVQHTSRSLLYSGVWYIPFNPLPQILNAQLLIRQIGIYSSPYLINQ